MSQTTHRRDISAADFKLLAAFSHAIANLMDNQERLLYRELGAIELILPTWKYNEQIKDWEIAAYKLYRKEAIGINTADFRRMCRYLKTKEAEVIDLLFRLSMLSQESVPQTRHKTFRQHFHSQLIGEPMVEAGFGFVLEKRRTLGEFR